MTELPNLRSFAWGLRFLPVVERIQEAQHSIIQRHIISRGKHSGPYISCRLRFAEVKDMVNDPVREPKFVEKFELVKNPDQLARRMGFLCHPLYAAAVANKQGAREKLQLASVIAYALDPESQFSRDRHTRELQAARKSHAAKKRRDIKNALLRHTGAQNERWSIDNVERCALAVHFQERLHFGRVYSVPVASVPLQSQAVAQQLLLTSAASSFQPCRTWPWMSNRSVSRWTTRCIPHVKLTRKKRAQLKTLQRWFSLG